MQHGKRLVGDDAGYGMLLSKYLLDQADHPIANVFSSRSVANFEHQ
ncbi:MAG: hypothetical protein L3J70_02275 [Gammaproteobacteria bacterium]|nr:hypothetical protein [Gammaproteobacteria bacterium]